MLPSDSEDADSDDGNARRKRGKRDFYANDDGNKEKKEREQEERELYERWAEEYFEIVEQLPMELHRTFALMRELEGRVQSESKDGCCSDSFPRSDLLIGMPAGTPSQIESLSLLPKLPHTEMHALPSRIKLTPSLHRIIPAAMPKLRAKAPH